MGGARASNKLFVEGPDDCFVIINLVQQLRADLQGDAKRWCGGFEIDTSNDDQALARFGDSLNLFDSHSRVVPAVQSSKERRKFAKAAAYRE